MKQKLFAWLRDQTDVFLFNSCGESEAENIGDYEIVLGLGCKTHFTVQSSEDFDAQTLKDFIGSGDWNFFALSYELKNAIHGLQSTNPGVLGWPLLSVVKPLHVICLSRAGELIIESEKEDLIRQAIEHQEVNKKDASYLKLGSDVVSKASMTQQEHHHKVEYIKQQIAEGNLYEMNLCMETVVRPFLCEDSLAIYQELIHRSPTPFSAFWKHEMRNVICASPERFIAKKTNRIYSQPIKGTSPRHENEDENRASRLHLANSLKERAEHIMIVDLVRNDLSKVSRPGSVVVDELFGIYGYRQVNQMISTISGELWPNADFVDCILATFPMGSMTGAPKHITMEFIDTIETASRGWYSGSLGYIKPNGDFDSNVVIRSLLYDSNKKLAKYAVGGAITYDSDPDAEYDECLLKSSAIRKVLGEL